MFRVCPLCDPHCSLCSQCVYTLCVPYVPSAFPNFPPVHSQLLPPVFPDCCLCSECVTCGRQPAVGPTLPTQKQSVLFTWFPVPSVFPIVSCVPSVFSIFPGVLSVFPIVYFVLSSQCVPDCVRFPIFPYCSQYVSNVFPIVSSVPSVVAIVPSVPY